MSKQGLICKLTAAKADFDPECDQFELDEKAHLKRQAREAELAEREAAADSSLEAQGLKGGVLGGIAIMAVALIWFFVAYEGGVIFFYPPILFMIGFWGFIKGLIDGNVSGKKH